MKLNKSYVNEIVKELEEENLALFLGAGFSASSGFVTWKELLQPLSEEIGLDINKETDLVAIAQYHCNENSNNRHKVSQQIIDQFSQKAIITENHKLVSKLPIKEYWTTNYDKLIETSLLESKRNPDVKYTVEQLAYTKPKRDCIVYKIHGDVDQADKAILTKDDYEKYHLTHAPFITALSGSLISKTFLFIGFSFTDPNIDYILSRIRVTYNNNQRRHYCFLRAVKQENFNTQDEFEYAKVKQKLFINDLQRFNIKTILVEEYSDITRYLKEISESYKRKTIFISGAVAEYGEIGKEESLQFIHELSKKLIKSNYRIVSGFGLGVGSSVITGALEQIYINESGLEKDQLLLRPFPQDESGIIPLKELWKKYREDMCDYSGIAIFIFGNKIENSELVISNGMISEFEIAHSKSLFIIPIGATGYASKEIYDLVDKDLSNYGYNTQELVDKFKLLNTYSTSKTLISTILEIIETVSHCRNL